MDLPPLVTPCPPAMSYPTASQPPGTNNMDAQQRQASTLVAQPVSDDQGELGFESSFCTPLHGGASGPQGNPQAPIEVSVSPASGAMVGIQESMPPVQPHDGFIAIH